ncbi:MAG: twin-arginine translocase subunit TatC, partial [Prevotella sp.]|nr:twin-arginine translocase subunit TatC [Prevotella sp.]
GIIFELPVICWILGRLGLLKSEWMTHYRRHAIVAILIIAAIITPTGDIFTLLVVSLPIYILYEASVFLVRR